MKDVKLLRWLTWCVMVTFLQIICLTSCFQSPSSSGTATPPTTRMILPTTVPPSISSTPVPFTPTPTPSPTFTVEEKEDFVREMLETNGGCELPCWWRIIPGETTWETLRVQFFSQEVGLLHQDGWYFSMPISEQLTQYQVVFHFDQEASIVHSIQVLSEPMVDPRTSTFAQDWHRYSLDQVLTRYGLPSQIRLLLVPPIERGAPPYYGLTLIYNDRGFSIHYKGPAMYEPPTIGMCPRFDEVNFLVLNLQSPQQDEPVLEPSEESASLPLEEAVGMDIETFYEIFREPGASQCLESTVEMWP